MPNLIQTLSDRGLITPPKWVGANTQYLCVTGSRAYGVAASDKSDWDLCAWAIPPKTALFPHITGAIPGFGTQPDPCLKPYAKAHIRDREAERGRGAEYDLAVYGIARYFNLCMACNPNMIDTLFVPEDCVLHCTRIGDMVRDRRELFLSKQQIWRAFKGYAKSQVHKLRNKQPEGKRKEAVEREGVDRKFAYHAVRLLDEAVQLLSEQALDLRRHADLLREIRADGGLGLPEILDLVDDYQRQLETAFEKTELPHYPREEEILQLLYDCLEDHFGSLELVQPRPGRALRIVQRIRAMIDDSGLPV